MMDQPFSSWDDLDWETLGLDLIFGLPDDSQAQITQAGNLGSIPIQAASSLAMTADTILSQINQPPTPDRFLLPKPSSTKGEKQKQPMRVSSSKKRESVSLYYPVGQASQHSPFSHNVLKGGREQCQESLPTDSAAVTSNSPNEVSQQFLQQQKPMNNSENPPCEQTNTVPSDARETVIDNETMDLIPTEQGLTCNTNPEQCARVLLNRKIRNRQSAKRSRERRMNRLTELQNEYSFLKEESERIKRVCIAVANENIWLRQQTEKLRENSQDSSQGI